MKEYYFSFMREHTCTVCNGDRLNKEVLSIRVGGLNIAEVCNLSLKKLREFLNNLKLTPTEEAISSMVLPNGR